MVRSSKLEFPNSTATATLAGRLDEPDGDIKAYALFAHCFTCSKDVLAASRIAGGLAARGIAVLRFDFTGLGGSAGDFANTNFSSNIADLVAAADYLRQNHRAPEILIGHSLGGAAVLAAAGDIPEAKAVATIGAPSDPSHVTHLFDAKAGEIVEQGSAQVQLAGRSFTIKRQFIEDVAQHVLRDKIAALHKALLIFHAPLDQIVGIENATWIFSGAKHPKSFVSLDSADHLLSQPKDAEYVADVLCAWASRYLDHAADETATDAARPAAPHGVLVEELGNGPYTQRVTARGHRLMADEPVSRGGQDKGPSPHEFILAGLGACSSITLRIYADRKGWALGRISVGLDLSRRSPPEGSNAAKIDVIEKVITVAGETTAEQREKLVEIADKCPMHRLLMAQGKVIETRFANESP
jgi:putative redox protein